MSDSERSAILRAELLLFGAVIIWAANYPLAKYALAGIDIFVFNSIRYVVATALIFGFFLARGEWTPVVRTDWRGLLQAGIIASIVYQIAFVIGLNNTTAGNSAVLLSTSPLWTVFLNARLHREKIAPAMWTGMFVSLAGVIMIIVGSGKKMALGGNELTGDIICLTAAALWGLSTNLQKPLLVRYSAMQLALIMIGLGAVGLTVAAVPALPSVHWTEISWKYYAATIASGILSIGIGNIVWSHSIRRLGPGKASNFHNLIPVMAFIMSYFLLGEHILPIQIAGAAVTIAGVWVVRGCSTSTSER